MLAGEHGQEMWSHHFSQYSPPPIKVIAPQFKVKQWHSCIVFTYAEVLCQWLQEVTKQTEEKPMTIKGNSLLAKSGAWQIPAMDCLKLQPVSGESPLHLTDFLCFSLEYPLLGSVCARTLGEMDSWSCPSVMVCLLEEQYGERCLEEMSIHVTEQQTVTPCQNDTIVSRQEFYLSRFWTECRRY